MKLKEGAVVAVVLNIQWARNARLDLFSGNPVSDSAETLMLICHLSDLNGIHGVWVEGRPKPAEKQVGRKALFIPWHAIISIIGIERFTSELWPSEKVGFQTVNAVE